MTLLTSGEGTKLGAESQDIFHVISVLDFFIMGIYSCIHVLLV